MYDGVEIEKIQGIELKLVFNHRNVDYSSRIIGIVKHLICEY